MEHIKKYWSLYLIGLVAIIVVVSNWNKWFGGNTATSSKDGDSCMAKDSFGVSIPGVYKNGICVPISGGAGGNGGGGKGGNENTQQ